MDIDIIQSYLRDNYLLVGNDGKMNRVISTGFPKNLTDTDSLAKTKT